MDIANLDAISAMPAELYWTVSTCIAFHRPARPFTLSRDTLWSASRATRTYLSGYLFGRDGRRAFGASQCAAPAPI